MRSFPIVLLALSACAADGPTRFATDSGAGTDMSAAPTQDGGLIQEDLGASPDAGGMPGLGEADELWVGERRGSEDADPFNAGTCFDGEDNDVSDAVSDGVDCDDPQCQPLRSCCVGSAACTGIANLIIDTDFSCDDPVCGTGFVPFGAPLPAFDEGSLALQGDDRYDSGWLGEVEHDLAYVRIEAEVLFRATPCAECTETAALAFTPQRNLGESDHVQPIIALRAALARDEVQLVVGDRVLASAPLFPNEGSWTLVLTPGRAVAQSGTRRIEAPFAPSHTAIALYGRSANPSAESRGLRLDALRIQSAPLDMPNAWNEGTSLVLDGARTSAARIGNADIVLVSRDTDVQFLRVESGLSEVLDWELTRDAWPGVEHALAVKGTDLYMYAVEDGTRLVESVLPSPSLGESLVIPPPSETLDAGSLGWSSLSEPSVSFIDDTRVLIARVGGTVRTAFFRDGVWRTGGVVGEGLAHPSIVVYDNAYWIHASEMRGIRPRVRAFVSDQLVYFRDLGVVLEGSGEERFDRFGVGSPSAVAHGGEMRLYYMGDDHLRQTLGFVRRVVPEAPTR